MSNAEVEAKFRNFAGAMLTSAQCDRALEAIWTLDKLPNLDSVFDGLNINP